jgi:hypothetical protein
MRDSHPLYEHTQIGWTMLILICLMPLPYFLTHLSARPVPWQVDTIVRVAALAGAVALILMCTLTIRVSRAELYWHFGPGLIRFRIALAEIDSVKQEKLCYSAGIGIHRSRRGWLYNVQGREVVVITRTSGRCVRLGTDDARRLIAVIERAKKDPHR